MKEPPTPTTSPASLLAAGEALAAAGRWYEASQLARQAALERSRQPLLAELAASKFQEWKQWHTVDCDTCAGTGRVIIVDEHRRLKTARCEDCQARGFHWRRLTPAQAETATILFNDNAEWCAEEAAESAIALEPAC